MDVVFGGLLGVKNYSKIEGVLLFLAASGQVLVLSDKEICVVLNIFLMQLASIYYLLAIIYSYLRCFLGNIGDPRWEKIFEAYFKKS